MQFDLTMKNEILVSVAIIQKKRIYGRYDSLKGLQSVTVYNVTEIIVGVESKAGLFFLWGADLGHARLKIFLRVNMTRFCHIQIGLEMESVKVILQKY